MRKLYRNKFCVAESWGHMSREASYATVGLCDTPGNRLCSELEKVNERQKNGRELLKK
jgi:hypothetical protein